MPTILELFNRRYRDLYNSTNIGGTKESSIDRNEGDIKQEFNNTKDILYDNTNIGGTKESSIDRNAGDIKKEFNNTRELLYDNTNIGGEKESNIDRNAGDIKKEFNSKQDTFTNRELYGLQGTAVIESRGIIDPRRQAALLLAQPSAVGGLIGSTVAGLIGGNANRPSDTIFSNPNFGTPVSATRPTQALLQNAIDPDKSYFVKRHPSPALLGNLSNIKNIATNPGAATSAAINVLNKYGSKNAAKGFLNGLKNPRFRNQQYASKFSTGADGKVIKDDITYTTHYKVVTENGLSTGIEFKEREKTKINNGESVWDNQNSNLITLNDYSDKDTNIKKFIDEEQPKINIPYVMFKVYGDGANSNRTILLPSTISGLSEEVTPSINTFKYVGSPFNLYRYNGVERVVRFDLKLYYTTVAEKLSIIRKLNLLREYAFPDRNLSAIKYENNSGYSPILFNPNILQFTINGLYNDIHCMIESLSLNVDDTVTWPVIDETNISADGSGNGETTPFPSVVNVSLSLKIIENASVKEDAGKFTYNYGKSDVEGNQYTNYFTNRVPVPKPYVEPPSKSSGYVQKGGSVKLNLSNAIEEMKIQETIDKLSKIINFNPNRPQ